MARGKDVLVGCGLGCLGLVVAGVASCVGFRMWLDAPGDLLEAKRLLGSDTTGYVEVSLSLDDPATARFVDETLEAMGPGEMEGLPDWTKTLLQLQQGRRARQFREIFPLVIGWTMTRGPTTEADDQLLSVSTERMGNRPKLARWVLSLILRRTEGGEVVDYRGRTLLRFPPDERSGKAGPILLLEQAQIHIGFTPEAVERAVDRLVEEQSSHGLPPAPVESWFAALPAESPVRGAIANDRGELVRLARSLLGEALEERDAQLLAELDGLTIAAGFDADNALAGTLELFAPESAWAVEHAAALAGLIPRVRGPLPVTVAGGPEIRGSRVRLSVIATDLPATFRFRPRPPRVERAPEVEVPRLPIPKQERNPAPAAN